MVGPLPGFRIGTWAKGRNRNYDSVVERPDYLGFIGVCLLFYIVLDETWSIMSQTGNVVGEQSETLHYTRQDIEYLQLYVDGLEFWVKNLEFQVKQPQDILE